MSAPKIAPWTHLRVKVGGVEYKSVREAFEANGFPANEVVRFRSRLKLAPTRRAVFVHEGDRFTFTLAK